jgi:hypothetical protein
MTHPIPDELIERCVADAIKDALDRSLNALESAGALDLRNLREHYAGPGSRYHDLVMEQLEFTARLARLALRERPLTPLESCLGAFIGDGFNRSMHALESAGALDRRRMDEHYKGVGTRYYDLVSGQLEIASVEGARNLRSLPGAPAEWGSKKWDGGNQDLPTRATPIPSVPVIPTIFRSNMRRVMRFPAATGRDPAVDAWLRAQGGDLGAIARHWFAVLRACGGDVRELLHDGQPTACVGDAAFAYVDVHADHVNVGFYGGAELDDPAGLLQGAGKFMRHVKLRRGAPVDAEALQRLVEHAYADMAAWAREDAREATPASRHCIRVECIEALPAADTVAAAVWGNHGKVLGEGGTTWHRLTVVSSTDATRRVDIAPVTRDPLVLEVTSADRDLAHAAAFYLAMETHGRFVPSS